MIWREWRNVASFGCACVYVCMCVCLSMVSSEGEVLFSTVHPVHLYSLLFITIFPHLRPLSFSYRKHVSLRPLHPFSPLFALSRARPAQSVKKSISEITVIRFRSFENEKRDKHDRRRRSFHSPLVPLGSFALALNSPLLPIRLFQATLFSALLFFFFFFWSSYFVLFVCIFHITLPLAAYQHGDTPIHVKKE